jgi:D-3-phosphoglycerate dehydrogenase
VIRRVLVIQPIHEAGVAALRERGMDVRLASRPDMAAVASEIGEADAVITRNAGLNRAAMDAAPRLRVVAVHGVGVDPVDVRHATALGIAVANTPGTNARSVAEHALALILALARQVPAADRAVREGRIDFKYHARLVELSGKTLGIVGCGRTGLLIARLARAGLGMRVLGYSPSADPARLARAGVASVSDLDTLLAASDVVSLHVPLTDSTRGLLDARRLSLMKPTAYLVNTARGGVVDEAALIRALAEGRIAGAGLDVFDSERMPPGYPLLALPNVILSPHAAGSSEEALRRTALAAARLLLLVGEGRRPRSLVNPEVWPRRRR